LWKLQEDEPMEMAAAEVRAKARRYRRESVLVYWVVLGLAPLLLAAFIHNIMRFRDPWLIVGQGFGLATVFCIAWRVVRNGPTRMLPTEPCVHFLRREFEGKRRGLLWVRGCLLLLIPAVLASWWGGGPVAGAKALGVKSPWLLSVIGGSAPLIVIAVLLALVWFAFSKEARRFERELENLRRE